MTFEEHYSAFPRLMGAPAYARPPAFVEHVARPFDPDELPLQIEQTPEERALLTSSVGTTWAIDGPAVIVALQAAGAAGGGAYVEPARSSAGSPGAAGGPLTPSSPLPGRPFSLRDLTDRLRARR